MKKQLLLLFCIATLMAGCRNKDINEPIKGFMIDAARDVETMEHYFRLIDFFSERDFNTIVFRLTDDAGCAMKFTSQPNLITHQGAYSTEEMKQLVAYANSKNIDLIPEIESFGHTSYITNTERYAFLKDYVTGKHFKAICPVSDTTLKIMKDLFTETAAVFTSDYIHIGCDELEFGEHELTKKALETRSKSEIFANYVNSLNSIAKSLGKKSIIWGDKIVFRNDSVVIDMLDKDIIVMDWNYWDTSKVIINNKAQKVLDNEFALIGGPAVNWWPWGIRVGSVQLENLKSFAQVYDETNHPENLGIIITHWNPKRYIQNAQWDSYALAADIMNDYKNFNFIESLKRFNADHYDAKWNQQWEVFYKNLYDNAPVYRPVNPRQVPKTFNGVDLIWIEPWENWEYIEEHIKTRDDPFQNPYAELAETARYLYPDVKKNRDDFNELILSLSWMSHIIERDNLMWSLVHNEISKKDIPDTLKSLADADHQWVKKLDSVWQKGRRNPMSDMHLWNFPRAADYSRSLADNPGNLR